MKNTSVTFVCFALIASSALAAAPIPKEKGRRLTGEECARMERLVPETANYLGMRGNGMKLIKDGKKGDFPEASEAMIRWVNEYNPESLLKHGYEMAPVFYKKCKNGTIRAPL
ncbi:MAG: hypothetical protein Q8S20_21430 [Sulfuritalea sp.]|nr:hypothetical protein [Sulfuritalea sp.]